ncbi:sporulation/spore germination protein [Oscillatoria sp. FACHB-1406]|uniref:sporulation/spore germination protein n=1 Tax=Oscillatoria sp. FACHB-1406 TaxID=2692846 RepID=UPI0016891743|nr:sporulation/spore germination protein [Oscillatoria sp. FACHB-1406]MBD2580036.1 sporulation/spore germination protein [Oscillatoria sp. FACHB-1406]
MQRTKKRFTSLIAGVLLVSASGCAISSQFFRLQSFLSLSPSETAIAQATSTSLAPTATLQASDSNPVPVPSSSSETTAPETIAVNLYYPDSNCETLVPESINVPEDNSLAAAVGRTIEKAASGDFDLAGYRVSVKDGVAAIDLRLSPNSPRHFLSMSGCEQFALFGSLRKTILENPEWNVKEVRFTEDGQELLF